MGITQGNHPATDALSHPRDPWSLAVRPLPLPCLSARKMPRLDLGGEKDGPLAKCNLQIVCLLCHFKFDLGYLKFACRRLGDIEKNILQQISFPSFPKKERKENKPC